MWHDEEKKYIRVLFAFLEPYGFKIEFKCFEKNSNERIKVDTIVAIVHNNENYFIIKGLRKYPLEPLLFYSLKSTDELMSIFNTHSDKEIDVYERDIKLWEKVLKKKKFLTYKMSLEVVCESIKNQIKESNSFYNIKI